MKVTNSDRRREPFFDFSTDAGGRLLRGLIGAVVVAAGLSFAMSLLARDTAYGAVPGRPTLRAAVAVSDAVVTVGDFFEGAGEKAAIPLFRAPDLGTTGAVSARRVVELARSAGFAEAEVGDLVEVEVTRLARTVEAPELARLIAAEALRQNERTLGEATLDDLRVTFDGTVDPIAADLRAATPVRVASLSLNPVNGRFDALVTVDLGNGTDRVRLRGEVVETVQVAVLARGFSRGDVGGRAHGAVDRLPRRQRGVVRPADPEQIVGLAARRTLRAGQPVSQSDFVRPTLVKNGDGVVVIFETRGLTVSGRGEAMESGALGDVVRVLNPQSKRTVIGTVAGPGRVVVSAAPKAVASIGRNAP